jgi:hypothetical protein
MASWSVHDVPFPSQVLPVSFSINARAFIPSASLAMALRLPSQPPSNETSDTVPFSSRQNAMRVEQISSLGW